MTRAALALLSGGAAQGLVEAVAPRFAADTGCSVTGSYGAVGAMRDRLLAGTAADLVILSQSLVDELCRDGHARAPAQAIGRVETAVAVRVGTALPEIADAAALRRALLAADAVYFPDPERATAGIHFAGVLAKLAIADRLADRLKPYPNGNAAMRALAAAGGNPIGCTQVTEILATPGVALVGPLPAPHGLATTYAAVVTARATQPVLAAKLAGLLASRETAVVRQKLGFVCS